MWGMQPRQHAGGLSDVSRVVETIGRGKAREMVIARNGRPADPLVSRAAAPPGRRIGVARRRFELPDDIDALDAEVARLYLGEATGS